MAWRFRKDSKGEFLSGNRTRTGQDNNPSWSGSGVERDNTCRTQGPVTLTPDSPPLAVLLQCHDIG